MEVKLGEPKPCPKCGHYNPPGKECYWCDGTHKFRIKGETMKLSKLRELLKTRNPLEFQGECIDCRSTVIVRATQDGEDTTIEGGAVFHPPGDWHSPTEYLYKCDGCYEKNPTFNPRTQVYSRVCGFLTPVNQWNNGKRAEWKSRKTFAVESMNVYP